MNKYHMMATVRKYFISGLLLWLPIWVTILVFTFLFDLLSKSLLLLPVKLHPDTLLGVHIPGIGVLITLLVIFLTGMFAANFIGKRLVALGDGLVSRIPLVRTIYVGVKQIVQSLFTPGGQSFRKVLLVHFPHKDVWTVAFQTGEVSPEIHRGAHDESMISFFVPTTPNPTSGFLMMAPKSEVIELDMSVDQALKFVISLGVVQPPVLNGIKKTP